jgi:hypothetical protein
MKALTLWEPYAGLVRDGWKEVETRSWYTSYRGPLAIHAATREPNKVEQSRISFLLASLGAELPTYHFGCVVAICHLAACVPTYKAGDAVKALKPPFIPKHGWAVEIPFGNYDVGRWAWILRDVRPVSPPIAARGYRKLWDFPQLSANRLPAKVAV